jgi:hypothetical protein
VVLHASGTPNSMISATDDSRCLSFAEAEERGWNVTALREEYAAAVEAFPERRSEVAAAWSELQYALRDQLQENGLDVLLGRSMFSVVLFEPDGRIARFIHRGLDADQESVLCAAVEELADEYRFPLESKGRFSQCGTTHFGEE